MKWPGSAGWVKAKPPRDETLAARQSAPRNTPQTAPCQTNRRIHNIQYKCTGHFLFTADHKSDANVLTHLSTESKVFLSGGGRALTFLGAGPSLSVCGGGRLGSVADEGGRGEEGRDSFHPAFKES